VNAEPGFLTEVLDALPQFPDCDRDVNLVSDAMAIKKGKIWDPATQRFTGFIDYGNSSITSDAQATEALFFMLVSLNGKWKLPVAYFLVNKPSGKVQGELINTALRLTDEKGIRVRGVTFDGAASNLSAARYLAKQASQNLGHEDEVDGIFELDEIDDTDELDELLLIDKNATPSAESQLPYYFYHPTNGSKIHIILDPSHMIKLARNALGKTILWQFCYLRASRRRRFFPYSYFSSQSFRISKIM